MMRLRLHPAEAPRLQAFYGPAIPAIALAATIASTAVGVMGSIQQGNAADAQAKYQAAVSRNNQQAAEYAAQDALKRGQIEEQKSRMRTAKLRGRQRAVLASNGVVVDQDSALDITTDTTQQGEYEALTVRDNAAREALTFRQQGANFGSEAQLYAMRGKAASSEGLWSSGATLLNGVGSVASKWYQFNRVGVETGIE